MGRLEQHSGVGGMLSPKCHLLWKLHSPLGDPPGQASQVAQSVKNSPAVPRPGFDPWVGKIPWRRAWQPTSIFLLGESP